MTDSLTGCGNAAPSPSQVTLPHFYDSPGGREALFMNAMQQNGQWPRLQLVTWPSEDYCWAVLASGRPEPTPPPNASSSFPSPSIQLSAENQEDDCVDETLASQSSPTTANSRGVKRKRGRKPIDRSNLQCHVPACNATQSKKWFNGPDDKILCKACWEVYRRAILNKAKKILGVKEINSLDDAKAALEKPEDWGAAMKLFYDRRATVFAEKQTQSKEQQEKPKVCQECNEIKPSRNGPDKTRICDACYMIFQRAVKRAYNPKQANGMHGTDEQFSIALAQEVLSKEKWAAVLADFHKRVKEKREQEKPSGIDTSNFQCQVPGCERTQSKGWSYGHDGNRLCRACWEVYRRAILNKATKILGVEKISFKEAKAALDKEPENWEPAMKLFYDRRATALAKKQTQSKEGQEKPKVCQECNKTEISSWRSGPKKTKICGACYMIFFRAVKGACDSISKQANDMLEKEEQFSIAAAKKVLKNQKKWEKVLEDFHKAVQETRGTEKP
jgi:hypothetical protein